MTPPAGWSSEATSSELFCVRYSFDDAYIAASYANGVIKVFDAKTGKEEFILTDENHKEKENVDAGGHEPLRFPTTQLRWRPDSAQSKTKNVLISVNAETDGLVKHWHVKSGKCLHSIKETMNSIFCLDYFADGTTFCTAGRDRNLRVYDEATKKLKCQLSDGDLLTTVGHSNRVFALKCVDVNTIVSGGWDNTVQIWDLRKGYSIRSIFGVYICGDSVDVSSDGRQMLTGSWRVEDSLQLWDVSTGKLIENIPWRPPGHFSGSQSMLFSTMFSKDANNSLIAAGGTQENEAKVFNRKTGEVVAAVQTPKPVFSVDLSYDCKSVAVGAADGCLRILNIPS
eukprot:GEMP01043108.1.p1 GENE.GEMP01043108.1~~GEMP01043108.1.p1  ORF type:complete len:340 (+),score=59.31 GEMP01043108.1:121-1140(+)